MYLSTELRPWRLHFKDGRPDIALTDQEASDIRSFLKDSSERFYDFSDSNGAQYVFAKNDMKGLTKKSLAYQNDPKKPKFFYCEWGTKHLVHESCTPNDCWKKYGYSWVVLWRYIKEKWDIHENSQITAEMHEYAKMRSEQEKGIVSKNPNVLKSI